MKLSLRPSLQKFVESLVRSGRKRQPVGRRRQSVGPREAAGERSEALEPNREADLGHRVICHPQQRGRPLQPPGEEVGMGRLAEGAAKLAAEMRPGKAGRLGQIVHAEHFEVAGVGEILGSQKVASGRDE